MCTRREHALGRTQRLACSCRKQLLSIPGCIAEDMGISTLRELGVSSAVLYYEPLAHYFERVSAMPQICVCRRPLLSVNTLRFSL